MFSLMAILKLPGKNGKKAPKGLYYLSIFKKPMQKRMMHLKDNIDGVMNSLKHLNLVINNLLQSHNEFSLDIDGVDEKLFTHIVKYEMLTEDLKKTFVELLINDAKKVAELPLKSPDLYDESLDKISKIDSLLDEVSHHEDIDIEKSESLKIMVTRARESLNHVQEDLEQSKKEMLSEKSRTSSTTFLSGI